MVIEIDYLSEWKQATARTAQLVQIDEWLWDGGILFDQFGVFWIVIAKSFNDFQNQKETQFNEDWVNQTRSKQKISIVGQHPSGAFALLFYENQHAHIGWISKEQAAQIDVHTTSVRAYFKYIHPWAQYIITPLSNVVVYFGYGEEQKLAPYQHQNADEDLLS